MHLFSPSLSPVVLSILSRHVKQALLPLPTLQLADCSSVAYLHRSNNEQFLPALAVTASQAYPTPATIINKAGYEDDSTAASLMWLLKDDRQNANKAGDSAFSDEGLDASDQEPWQQHRRWLSVVFAIWFMVAIMMLISNLYAG